MQYVRTEDGSDEAEDDIVYNNREVVRRLYYSSFCFVKLGQELSTSRLASMLYTQTRATRDQLLEVCILIGFQAELSGGNGDGSGFKGTGWRCWRLIIEKKY